ncbi:MAG: MarR family transcriptional regulator [Acidimicrobiales bacterium]
MLAPFPSDTQLHVRHAIRLKGLAATAAIVAATRLDEATVVAGVDALAALGHVTERTGVLTGWALTPEGREAHARAIRAEVAQSGRAADVEDAYRRFLSLNGTMLALCTDWQLRDGAVNDHTDHGYDAAVLDRLRLLDGELRPVLVDLAAAFERFGSYLARVAAALDHIDHGDHDWFTRPVIDSYHTIWFELHEDLLATLGIARASESGSTPA